MIAKGLLPLFFAAATLFTQGTLACSCYPEPTLQKSLSATSGDFLVAKVKILLEDAEEILSHSNEKQVFEQSDTRTFNARILTSFNDCSVMRGTKIQVRTASVDSLCGVDFQENTKYLLTGRVSYEENGQAVMTVGLCNYHSEWDALPAKEADYLDEEQKCQCIRNACGTEHVCPDGISFGGPVRGACHYDSVMAQCVATETAVCAP